jgi:hypothetical protein
MGDVTPLVGSPDALPIQGALNVTPRLLLYLTTLDGCNTARGAAPGSFLVASGKLAWK